jgi:hypothetical protein
MTMMFRTSVTSANRVSAAVASPRALSGPLRITWAPRLAGCRAAASPVPLLPPVTSAVLPAKSCIMD